MQGFSGSSTWKWLSNLTFLVFFTLSTLQGNILHASGWLALLAGGGLNASGAIERSRTLAYLAGGCLILGVLLLITALVLDFAG